MINSNRSSIIVSDKLKHGNKVVSFTSIKSIMNKLQTGSKCQNNTDSGQYTGICTSKHLQNLLFA